MTMFPLHWPSLSAAIAFGIGWAGALGAERPDDSPGPEDIIPKFVVYEPPAGYVRNPDAPQLPEWHHPDHDHMPGIGFTFLYTENLFGEFSEKLENWPDWKTLRERLKDPRWPPVYRKTDRVLTETIVDGKAALVLDFTLNSLGDPDYWTIVWIPVAPNLFVEAHATDSNPAGRQQLKESILQMRINRYWAIPGSEQVSGTSSQIIDQPFERLAAPHPHQADAQAEGADEFPKN